MISNGTEEISFTSSRTWSQWRHQTIKTTSGHACTSLALVVRIVWVWEAWTVSEEIKWSGSKRLVTTFQWMSLLAAMELLSCTMLFRNTCTWSITTKWKDKREITQLVRLSTLDYLPKWSRVRQCNGLLLEETTALISMDLTLASIFHTDVRLVLILMDQSLLNQVRAFSTLSSMKRLAKST